MKKRTLILAGVAAILAFGCESKSKSSSECPPDQSDCKKNMQNMMTPEQPEESKAAPAAPVTPAPAGKTSMESSPVQAPASAQAEAPAATASTPAPEAPAQK